MCMILLGQKDNLGHFIKKAQVQILTLGFLVLSFDFYLIVFKYFTVKFTQSASLSGISISGLIPIFSIG
jgi:hypothetical protein